MRSDSSLYRPILPGGFILETAMDDTCSCGARQDITRLEFDGRSRNQGAIVSQERNGRSRRIATLPARSLLSLVWPREVVALGEVTLPGEVVCVCLCPEPSTARSAAQSRTQIGSRGSARFRSGRASARD